MLTFLLPGGAGSNILVCISLGSALYTGRMINSGTCSVDSNIINNSDVIIIRHWSTQDITLWLALHDLKIQHRFSICETSQSSHMHVTKFDESWL